MNYYLLKKQCFFYMKYQIDLVRRESYSSGAEPNMPAVLQYNVINCELHCEQVSPPHFHPPVYKMSREGYQLDKTPGKEYKFLGPRLSYFCTFLLGLRKITCFYLELAFPFIYSHVFQ